MTLPDRNTIRPGPTPQALINFWANPLPIEPERPHTERPRANDNLILSGRSRLSSGSYSDPRGSSHPRQNKERDQKQKQTGEDEGKEAED